MITYERHETSGILDTRDGAMIFDEKSIKNLGLLFYNSLM
jgi:hypothetical protein